MRELPYTIALTHPVAFGTDTITELVFTRKPVAGDLRGISLRELDKADNIIALGARLTAQPPKVISQLDLEDFASLGEVVMDFLQAGQKTGSEPAV